MNNLGNRENNQRNEFTRSANDGICQRHVHPGLAQRFKISPSNIKLNPHYQNEATVASHHVKQPSLRVGI